MSKLKDAEKARDLFSDWIIKSKEYADKLPECVESAFLKALLLQCTLLNEISYDLKKMLDNE